VPQHDPSGAPFRPELAAVALHRFGVEWVVVGPFALAAYGAPVDEMAGLDVLPEGSAANLRRLSDSLYALRAAPSPGSHAEPGQYDCAAGRLSVCPPTAYADVRVAARSTLLGGTDVMVAHPTSANPPYRVAPTLDDARVQALPMFPSALARHR